MEIRLVIDRGERAKPSVAWQPEGRRILEDAARAAAEPNLTDLERSNRLNWLGGAIRLYALAAGEDPVAVRSSLPSTAPTASAASVPAPSPAAGLAGMFAQPVPPAERESRPPLPPGAPRPVDPDAPTVTPSEPEIRSS